MAATAPILDQVRSASVAEKKAILEALLREWATSPTPLPSLSLGQPSPVLVNGVFTEEHVTELRRRIANLDDSSDLQDFIDKL